MRMNDGAEPTPHAHQIIPTTKQPAASSIASSRRSPAPRDARPTAHNEMIDIGANLTNRQYQRDLPQVLRRAAQAGVSAVLVTGTSARASADAVRLARRFSLGTHNKGEGGAAAAIPRLFATVGVHPHDAKDFREGETLAELRALIESNRDGVVVAVGECGLDFNRNFSSREDQERAFRTQVALACELQLPLFLHEREAHEAFVGILEPFRQAQQLPPVVVHCFTGTERELRAYVALGYYIGLTGFVCMDSRGFKLRQMASLIPLDRLLVETDAPYMYPYSRGGGKSARSRCEPKDVRAVIETLASCYGLTPDEIARHTTDNATRVFQLDRYVARPASSAAIPPPAPLPTTIKTNGVVDHPEDLVSIDGGSGEGGGQLLRVSMALAALLRRTIRIHSIRANRRLPGLRNQHLGTVELAREVSGGRLDGAHLNSTALTFDARHATASAGKLGEDGRVQFAAESRTGGSVALMVQGVLPIALFGRAPVDMALKGGTHVAFSPAIDFMQVPLRDLLSRFGAQVGIEVKQRMFNPGSRSLGLVELSVEPLDTALAPVDLSVASSEIARVFTRVSVMGPAATEPLAQQYVDTLETALTEQLAPPSASSALDMDWDIVVERSVADAGASSANPKASRQGKHHKSRGQEKTAVSVLCVAHTSTGGILTTSHTEAFSTAAQAGVASSSLADHVAKELAAYVRNAVCVDEHLADNAVVYMALARGTSRLRVPSKANRSSQHLETALDMVHRLAGVQFRVEEELTSAVVEVDGLGLAPRSRA